MTRVLIVDDDPIALDAAERLVGEAGYRTLTATGGAAALALLRTDPTIAAVILDLAMPDLDGMAVLEAMRRERLMRPVIVQVSAAGLDMVETAMRAGASDFILKPVTAPRLLVSLRNMLRLDQALRTDPARLPAPFLPAEALAAGPQSERLLALCRKAAKAQEPVLVEGEPGTGKRLVAGLIQGLGDRRGKPFVTVNCAALPEARLEAALIAGFAEAHHGTLLLADIDELSPPLQVRLLHTLETGQVGLPNGRPATFDVRLLATSCRRLLDLARAGEFREDLYYRLNVLPIYLPPLSRRPEEIAVLAGRFLARFAAEAGRHVAGISPEALALLAAHEWPGNVRQLENAVCRAVALADGDLLVPADFPQLLADRCGRDALAEATVALPLVPPRSQIAGPAETAATPDRFLTPTGELIPLAGLERDLIAFALRHHQGRMSRVARALGIGRSTLYRKLREYGLDAEIVADAA